MKRKAVVSSSSGKESAWLVHVQRRTEDVEPGALLTTVNESARRVATHAVRTELLEAQAYALGLPRWSVPIRYPCLNETHERAMAEEVAHGAGALTLAREMIATGAGARLTCVDTKNLARSFSGREFDARLLDDLPPGVDPRGERGGFHSFACRGPMFSQPIPVETGIVVERDGFAFTDLVLASSSVHA